MNPVIHGERGIVYTNPGIVENDAGQPEGRLSFSVAGTLASAKTALPKIGSVPPTAPGMTSPMLPAVSVPADGGARDAVLRLSRREINVDESTAMCSGTLIYSVPDNPPEWAGITSKLSSYSLDASPRVETILSLPKYAKLPPFQLAVCKLIIDGAKLYDVVYVSADGTQLRASQNDAGTLEETTIYDLSTKIKWSTDGAECFQKCLRGITSYQSAGITWTESRLESGFPNLTSIGKIDNPNGPAPSLAQGGNWILSAISAQTDGNEVRVVRTWTASDVGGQWDAEIYKK